MAAVLSPSIAAGRLVDDALLAHDGRMRTRAGALLPIPDFHGDCNEYLDGYPVGSVGVTADMIETARGWIIELAPRIHDGVDQSRFTPAHLRRVRAARWLLLNRFVQVPSGAWLATGRQVFYDPAVVVARRAAHRAGMALYARLSGKSADGVFPYRAPPPTQWAMDRGRRGREISGIRGTRPGARSVRPRKRGRANDRHHTARPGRPENRHQVANHAWAEGHKGRLCLLELHRGGGDQSPREAPATGQKRLRAGAMHHCLVPALGDGLRPDTGRTWGGRYGCDGSPLQSRCRTAP